MTTCQVKVTAGNSLVLEQLSVLLFISGVVFGHDTFSDTHFVKFLATYDFVCLSLYLGNLTQIIICFIAKIDRPYLNFVECCTFLAPRIMQSFGFLKVAIIFYKLFCSITFKCFESQDMQLI